MASTTFTVLEPAITGVAITAKTGVASSETITIAAPTGHDLDMSSLMVRISAVGGSVTPTIGVSTEYSARGIGTAALTAIASSGSVVLGGKLFESARFLTDTGTVVITMAGTGTASIEAYQAPRAL